MEDKKMSYKKLYKYLLNLPKQNTKGISLTELLIALVLGSIVLTAAASGFINLLRANQNLESKTVRNASLTRALTFMQEDIKQGKKVEAVTPTIDSKCDSSKLNSQECLKVTTSDNSTIYYGFKDISKNSQIFLKPAILKRQEYDSTGTAIFQNSQSKAWEDEYTTVADALIGVNENQPTISCSQDGVSWSNNTIYGRNNQKKGGFNFCLKGDRVIRVLLYGYIDKNNDPIPMSTVIFARSE